MSTVEERIAQAEKSRDEAWAAYREAIGVPPSQHQRERLEQMAQAREESLKENAALRERIVELQAQVAGLEAMNTEKAAEIRRLRMGNHPAGKKRRGNEAVDDPAVLRVRAVLQAVPDADAADLQAALEERDAEHQAWVEVPADGMQSSLTDWEPRPCACPIGESHNEQEPTR